jgi:hypothetical protein
MSFDSFWFFWKTVETSSKWEITGKNSLNLKVMKTDFIFYILSFETILYNFANPLWLQSCVLSFGNQMKWAINIRVHSGRHFTPSFWCANIHTPKNLGYKTWAHQKRWCAHVRTPKTLLCTCEHTKNVGVHMWAHQKRWCAHVSTTKTLV